MRSIRLAAAFVLVFGSAPLAAAAQECIADNGVFRFLNTGFPAFSTNTEFVGRLVVVNADGPVVFSQDPGTVDPIPDGLTLDADSGFITGIADDSGQEDVTFAADDGVQTPITKEINFSISSAGGGGNGGSEVSNNVFPDGHVGEPYTHTLAVTNGVGPFTFGGSDLPPGLSLNGATGELSGTPSSPGTYFASFTVYDAGEDNIGDTVLPIRIFPADPSAFAFVTQFLNNGEVGTLFCDQYLTQGEAGPVTFGASGLPAGLVLDPATGAVTGTPTEAGTFLVTLTASDGSSTLTTNLSMIIAPSSESEFHWNYFGLPAALVDTLYDRQPAITVSAEGAVDPVTYSAVGLPAGISYDAGTGELSGTATQQGEYPVTFTATDGTDTITLDAIFVVLPATGGDVSQIIVNFWVTRASLKLGEDGKESWRASAIYNTDRRTGNRYDASTDVFEALLGSRVLHIDPGECTGTDPQQACSFKTPSGEVPVEGAKLTPDKQTLAWSTSSDTLTESVPGVLSQTVKLGDDTFAVKLRFDEKGGFRPALAFERTVFVLSKGTLGLKGPGLDAAKLSLLLADPNFAYESGVSTLRVRILEGATVLLDRDFTLLGGPAKVGIDSKSGKPWVSFKTLPDPDATNRVAMGYSSSKGAMKLTLSNLDLSAITDGEAHLTFEITIGSRVYSTGVTFFEPSEGKYGLAIP